MSDRLLELFFYVWERGRDAAGTISSAFGFLKKAKRAVLTGHNMASIFFLWKKKTAHNLQIQQEQYEGANKRGCRDAYAHVLVY